MVCIPTYQERGVSLFISYRHQCLEHWAQWFFIRVIYTTTYQRLLTKGVVQLIVSCYIAIKNPEILRIFGNFREFLENFRHFEKNFSAFWGEIQERILDNFSGIMWLSLWTDQASIGSRLDRPVAGCKVPLEYIHTKFYLPLFWLPRIAKTSWESLWCKHLNNCNACPLRGSWHSTGSWNAMS